MQRKEIVFIDPLYFVYTVIDGQAIYYYVLEDGRALMLGPRAEQLVTAARTHAEHCDQPIKMAITVEYEPHNYESYVAGMLEALTVLTK